jgi:rubredoxin
MNQTNHYDQFTCPKCGAYPKEDIITEHCNLTPMNNSQVDFQEHCEIFNQTLKANASNPLLDKDPCMDCRHNQTTQHPGTFLEIATIFHEDGSFQFEETHECHQCHFVYKFFNTKERLTR